MASNAEDGPWYWCIRHNRPEPEGEQCAAINRLGPYPSRQEALDWRARVQERNDQWDEDDRRWEAGDPPSRRG